MEVVVAVDMAHLVVVAACTVAVTTVLQVVGIAQVVVDTEAVAEDMGAVADMVNPAAVDMVAMADIKQE